MTQWLIFLTLLGVASAWVNSTPTNMLRVSHAAAAWIDVDNNAKPDLLASGTVTGAIASNLALLKNAGDYRFSDVSPSLPPGSALPFVDGSVISADFDNVTSQARFSTYSAQDGGLELFWTGYIPSQDRVGCGLLSWTNSSATPTDVSSRIGCIPSCCIQQGATLVVDFNTDGILDLFVAGIDDAGAYQSSVLLFNSSSGYFTDATAALFPTGLVRGRFLDAAWDAVGSVLFIQALDESTSAIVGGIYSFDSTSGQYQDATARFPASPFLYGGCVQWSDLLRDGSADLLQCGSTGNETRCNIWSSDAIGAFTLSTIEFGPALPNLAQCSISIADYNIDARPDVFVCGATQLAPLAATPVCRLYRQLANNSFVQDTILSAPGLSFAASSFVQFDDDCLPDLVIMGTDSNGNPRGELYRNSLDISLCVVPLICPSGLYGLNCNCTTEPPLPLATCSAGEAEWVIPIGVYNNLALGNTTVVLTKPLIVNANFSLSNSTVMQLMSVNGSSVPNITIAGKYNCIQMAGNVSAVYNHIPKLGVYNTTFVIANCTRGTWLGVSSKEVDPEGCRMMSVKNTNYKGDFNGTKTMYTQVFISRCNEGFKIANLAALFISLGFAVIFGIMSFIAFLLHQRKVTTIFSVWFAPIIYEAPK